MKLPNFPKKILFLGSAQLLYVDGMFHLQALQNRRFVKLLTTTQLFHNTSLFELSLELLEGLFDVLAFFYGYNNHCFLILIILKLLDISAYAWHSHTKCGCKITTYLPNYQAFMQFLSFLRLTLRKNTCRERDSNPHNHSWSRDFKSLVSTIPPSRLVFACAKVRCFFETAKRFGSFLYKSVMDVYFFSVKIYPILD